MQPHRSEFRLIGLLLIIVVGIEGPDWSGPPSPDALWEAFRKPVPTPRNQVTQASHSQFDTAKDSVIETSGAVRTAADTDAITEFTAVPVTWASSAWEPVAPVDPPEPDEELLPQPVEELPPVFPVPPIDDAQAVPYDDVPSPIFLECGEDMLILPERSPDSIFAHKSEAGDDVFPFTASDDRYQSALSSFQDQSGHGHCEEDEYCDVCDPCSPWYKVFRSFCFGETCDRGIGQERLMYAPFDMEVPLPSNYFAIRYDSAKGLRFPDRAEYFWASQNGAGPDEGETVVDYQDLRFIMSTGSDSFSLTTELPLRFIDATRNGTTGGFGDMSVATKLVMIDGKFWKITQFFKTIMSTGSAKRGVGTGHVSLEPGLLAQYQWNDTRYWFGELRFWFPVGADPVHAGNVLRYGIGTSKLWYETDAFAAMRTLEFVGVSVLTGEKTLPNGTDTVTVNGEHSMAVLPGIRLVLGPAGDLGLFELGFQGGVAVNRKGFYTSLGRLELRFNF